MIDPLAISTEVLISRSIRRTITIGTIGWIVLSGSQSSDVVHVRESVGGHHYEYEIKDKRILRLDDNEVIEIIKAFTECRK